MGDGGDLEKQPTCLTELSSSFVSKFESAFFRWGFLVCKNPWTFIVSCCLITATCAIGMLNFTAENRPTKLWIPQDSGFVEHTDWLQDNFPNDMRFNSYIFLAENVLNTKHLLTVLEIHNGVRSAISKNGFVWSDVCFKLPVVNEESSLRRSKRDIGFDDDEDEDLDFDFEFGDFPSQFDEASFAPDPNFEPSIDLPVGVFCDIVKNLKEACFESNLLEMWHYDAEIIGNLTQQDIIDAVNRVEKNSLTGTDYASLLGKPKRNETGHIIGAESLMVQFFSRVNFSAIVPGVESNDAGTGDVVDPTNLEWEEAYLNYMGNVSSRLAADGETDLILKYMAARSFGDISGATILGDVNLLTVGVGVLFVYVQLMLGKFNMVEQRVFLSLMGIFSVAMAIFVSYGLCSAFGVFYGPVHSILPFLLLGIGIDDMFVIVSSWNNLSKEDRKGSLAMRIGSCMRHAGVSITVTSVTDFMAFAVGATTVLPSLRSFCIYSAIGILATYLFQASFFVAWLSLDQRRIESHRNGVFPWYKHRDWKPNAFSRIEPLQSFFDNVLAKYMFRKPAKVLILLLTATSLGLNVWGSMMMRQEFNPLWFIPKSTYLSQYFTTMDEFYPNQGERATVYVQSTDLHDHLEDLDQLLITIRNETEIVNTVDDWLGGFKALLSKRYSRDNLTDLSDGLFRVYLKNYLFTQDGAKYRSKFKFDSELSCYEDSTPPIQMTSFDFSFKPFDGREQHIPAMQRIKVITENASIEFGSSVFPWARAFATWETDEIIMVELYRNLAIAMACVFFTIMALIANFYSCLLVLSCVFFTLICVNGSMHFWGLTIDTVSCINLVLAIGLCVDYAAHVAHTFMTTPGTRDERAITTVKAIGPAVFHGGFSTFLAFIFLADSDSHVFLTFFKIFVLVVAYGLFHGLIFFPVLLSICGPPAFNTAHSNTEHVSNAEELEPQLKPTTPALEHATADDVGFNS